MKLYVKQMYDWNYYGYYAEDVNEKDQDYFKTELQWQLVNGFIKTYDNVEGNKIYVSTLEMLKKDNELYGRPERVKLIKERMRQT